MTTAITALDEFKQNLEKRMPEYSKLLPAHVDAQKFERIVYMAVAKVPALLTCDRASLYVAVQECAQDGLIPDGKEATILPYKGKAKYSPGYIGLLKKVRNSGELASITAQIVHDKDIFEYNVDENGEHIKHVPNLKTERGPATHVYALAKTKDGAVYIEIMTMEQVEAVRNSSPAKDSGPWAGPFKTEMWKKTVFRRISKRLPMSSDLEQVITRDDDMYELDKEQEPATPSTKSSRLEKIVEAEVVPPQAQPAEPAAVPNPDADDAPEQGDIPL